MTQHTPALLPSPSIVIVGGGIGGLYAARLLRTQGYDVTVLEQGERWGGRIESVKLPAAEGPFTAEFGPMRFEPQLQEKVVTLAKSLGIGFAPFAPTTAPAPPTDYDLTDVEEALTPAELMVLAVLRMFYGRPSQTDLEAATAAGANEGQAELALLRAKINAAFEGKSYDDVQKYFDGLRANARLADSPDADSPLLREMGLWNALAEVVTPGALAKIRDSGTFYHFIPHNPSAVEWGIFWLRQASDKGAEIQTFSPTTAPRGIQTLVDKLVAELTEEGTLPTVHLRPSQSVLSIQHGKHGDEVELTVLDCISRQAYTLRADHVILALPQTALQKLSAAFPQQVRQDIESVMPLPLLKAFLVTDQPWWRHHQSAQSHAWLVPTRELHYFTHPLRDDCPQAKDPAAACHCADKELGMVMLYTDIPAIDFWRSYVPNIDHYSATIYPTVKQDRTKQDNIELKKALVRHLLIDANPDASTKIDIQRVSVIDRLLDDFGETGRQLVDAARPAGIKLSTVLRDYAAACPDDERARLEDLMDSLFGPSDGWVEKLCHPPEVKPFESYMESVVAYGIHDWSSEPFGGAAHSWRAGADSIAIRERLNAFSLVGRETNNLHVCGEAYSDFQGFIEGALSTAEQVVSAIAKASPTT